MVGAISGDKVSPDMMIDPAMHIVAAWVAYLTKSSASQREEEVEELVEMLPYIEYHRTAGWLPDLTAVTTEVDLLGDHVARLT